MVKYYFEDEKFVIEGYDKAKPFASFLPSIAGLYGIPTWVYYVNRGQSIAGFGVENKDNPMMDFVPANAAYRRTELVGFRTFIKIDGKVYEFFSSMTSSRDVKRTMYISRNAVKVNEENLTLQLAIEVEYVTITNQNYPGIVRYVRVKNLSGKPVKVELLDGLANLWPYGTNDFTTKNMSNLGVAWFDVVTSAQGIPFYKNRSTTADSSSMSAVSMGHFYASYTKGSTKPLPVIYDFELVFGQNSALTIAEGFAETPLRQMLKEQYYVNKFSCAFASFDGVINEELEIGSLVGRMSSIERLDLVSQQFSLDFVKDQLQQAYQLGEDVSKDCVSETSSSMFDAYVRQCFMDNLLRGGYPLVFNGKDGKPIIYHVYSRVHGDMEREYNYFQVEPSPFSQGNGNFRDVNQNRRNDIYFVKEAGFYNLKQFMELIQLDGFNPLGIQGSKLLLDPHALSSIVKHAKDKPEVIEKVLQNPFTPGQLLRTIDEQEIKIDIHLNELIDLVMKHSTQEIQANYGHGYWVDHWTYNMDLIENYLNIYPENLHQMLFEEPFRYFVSPTKILTRADKYVLTKDHTVRQYDAVIHQDKEKIEKCHLNPNGTNWSKTPNNEVYTSPLYTKLLSLVVNKFADLDQYGIGIMMNADKPGWNDSMNGLPGIFGSGVSETIELNRILAFLLQHSTQDEMVKVYAELYQLMNDITLALKQYHSHEVDELGYWERVQDAKEHYLQSIHFGIKGNEVLLNVAELEDFLTSLKNKVQQGIDRAIMMSNEGIVPTYFVYEATEYEVIPNKFHPTLHLPNVKVTKWQGRFLPLFLEAPARYLKQLNDHTSAKKMYDFIKESEMYDEKIKMYITSQSLDNESLEIGRTRAFTPGWLEREACFMHMEYKYLLGLLKSGLYDEFFHDIQTCLVPFTDPAVYGRSTLENSSFIASSKNPDPHNHGRGFQARLTGTSSEMLSMWIIMMMGKHLFTIENEELTFTLSPILHQDMFKNHQVSFKLLGKTKVTYINERLKNTYGEDAVKPVSYGLYYADGKKIRVQGNKVSGRYASDIRDGLVSSIEVVLE